MYSGNYFFIDFCAATIASLILHPFHYAESRMILNNRLPNFGAYKSLFTLALNSRDPAQLIRGTSVHIPINFTLAFTGFNYFTSTNIYTYLLTQLTFYSITYPLLTVQRRLECQSAKNAGMIPMRYIGPLHAFGLTLREEGFKGLYRGYFAYLIATAIFTTGVPLYAETSCMNKPITGYYDDDVNKMYDEVMRKN
jgi:hypothetical protein